LKHFYANFNDINDMWNRFNKELGRLETADFIENKRPGNESVLTTLIKLQTRSIISIKLKKQIFHDYT